MYASIYICIYTYTSTMDKPILFLYIFTNICIPIRDSIFITAHAHLQQILYLTRQQITIALRAKNP